MIVLFLCGLFTVGNNSPMFENIGLSFDENIMLQLFISKHFTGKNSTKTYFFKTILSSLLFIEVFIVFIIKFQIQRCFDLDPRV